MISQPFALNPIVRRRWFRAALYLSIVLAVVAGFAALWWVDTLPDRVDDQLTVVVGQTRFAPGSEGSVRVVVQDYAAGDPIAGAQVHVRLEPSGGGRAMATFSGETDETGSLPVSFAVPEDAAGEAKLIVKTRSGAGRDVVEHPVTIERQYRLLLSSDKPLYQPGQVIHMRALALSVFDLTPARGATVHFLVEDAKGNKVFRQDVATSDFGIAAADFQLADMVNQGNYKLSVTIDETVSERTVEVRPYVLPKFGVDVSTDRSFYLPGQRVEGVVQADYFFGKPVAQGQVQIVGSVWDVERTVLVDLTGQTDESGNFEFSFDLPDYFAGSGLESGQAQFALEVTVVDQTDHAEQTSTVLPVAEQPIIIEAVAESGLLKPGVENIVYVLTSTPDGRPVPTTLQVSFGGETAELATGEYGLAEFTFTPQGHQRIFQVVARDETGLEASRSVDLAVELGSDSVLLRADRAAYLVGETMNLTALTAVESGSVYLDIVKDGQTMSTRSAKVEGGRVEFAVDLSPDLYGTLELHAYKVLYDGTIVRDTRIVVVDEPNEVDIGVTTDENVYLPGDTATIDFQTNDAAQGGGLQTALGVAVVDESVFALQQQDPGFAKLYFMLERELMEPFYQIKGFELPAAIPPDEESVRLAQDDAAKAAWAGGSVAGGRVVNSQQEKLAAVQEGQVQGYAAIGRVTVWGLVLIPLGLWAVVIVVLRRSGFAIRSLKRALAVSGLILLIVGCLSGWFVALTDAYYYFDPAGIFIWLAIVFGLGVFFSTIYAWVKRDTAARFLTLFTLAWPALLVLLLMVTDYSRNGDPPEGLALAALIAFASVPGAYLLFGQARWVQQRRLVGGLFTGLGAIVALPVMVMLPLMLFFSPMVGMSGVAPSVQLEDAATLRSIGEVQPLREPFVVEPTLEAPEEKMEEAPADPDGQVSEEAGEAPRLRQYFPETLYWAPEVLTDEAGFASLEIPMADSITTWRLTALASSQEGRLGFATHGVRVFQDFFVDIDLPVALTQGDEISIPVGVFNYLSEAQEVRLEVQQEDWFELLDAGRAEQALTIASNDIDVVYFPIRVLDFGRQGFQVTAWGTQMSDAIRREVTVVPDGQAVHLTQSDWLQESETIEIEIPPEAVPETPYVEVKIYPGAMAQVVEGLEKILRLPHG